MARKRYLPARVNKAAFRRGAMPKKSNMVGLKLMRGGTRAL